MNNIVRSVCWDITSECNDNCAFCYRNSNNKVLSLEDNKVILKKLIDLGVGKVSFVGGEPLLYNDLFELVRWGVDYGNKNTLFSLTTNAILLTKYNQEEVEVDGEMMDKVYSLFDWISFSLDGFNNKVQSKVGRNSKHFDRIMVMLEYIANRPGLRTKINTMVCQHNKYTLKELMVLLGSKKVDRWKLFQFLPSRGSALEHKDDYYISRDEFDDVTSELLSFSVGRRIKVTINGYDSFDDSYVTISSNGKLVIYDGGKYLPKVDLLQEDVKKVLSQINIDKHQRKRSDYLYIE